MRWDEDLDRLLIIGSLVIAQGWTEKFASEYFDSCFRRKDDLAANLSAATGLDIRAVWIDKERVG